MGIKISPQHPFAKKMEELFKDAIKPDDVAKMVNPYVEIPQYLVSRGMVTKTQILKILEEFYKIPYIHPMEYNINVDALDLISRELSRDMWILPLNVTDDHLLLAMSDPWDLEARVFVEMKTGLRVKPVIALKDELTETAEKMYGSEHSLSRAIKNIVQDIDPSEFMTKKKSAGPIEWEDAPVIKLVNYIIQQGISLRASDIHLEPEEKGSTLRYRIDGTLHGFSSPPGDLYQAVVSRIKVLANLDVSESRFPQDGRIQYNIGPRTVDLRVSVIPFAYGEGVSIRILDKSRMSLDMDTLGFPDDQKDQLMSAIKRPHGLILSAGPTGSGKSTTLYAILKIIATPDKKVMSIEDPVEYQMKGVQQSPVRDDIGYTFGKGLRAMLRHDPDIIMIGEMRDLESAEIAVRSALTGHLVISTIHTNDSVQVITRLSDMGIPNYLVSAVLQLVVSQRLVRKLCGKCKTKVTERKERFKELGLDNTALNLLPDTLEVYAPVGCEVCNKLGYIGRTAVYEVLDCADLFRNMTKREVSIREMSETAVAMGMRTLRASGLRKVIEGITSMDEILRITADY